MNQQKARKAGRIAGNAILGAALLFLVTLTGTVAQSHSYAMSFS